MDTTFNSHYAPSFWDRIAPKYARKPIKDPAAYAAKLDALRALLKPTDTVLEVGCGTGTTALRLAPHVAHYTGADGSREMIGIAEDKRIGTAAHNLQFVVADAADTLPGAPFDVISAFSLLHLVEDLPKTLRAIHDQLRPGGLFVSKTVCLGETNLAVRLFVKVLHAVGIAPYVASLRQDQLRAALIEAGFEVIDCKHFGSGQTNPFFVARRPD